MDIEKILEEYDSEWNQTKEIVSNDSSLEYITDKFGIDAAIEYYRHNVDTSRKQKYLDTEEVQDTLKVFHLDSEKFWHLCLFIKDLVEGYANGSQATKPKTEIIQLINLLREVDVIDEDSLKSNGLLSLKVGKKTVKIDNRFTLLWIKTALSNYLKKYSFLLDDELSIQVVQHKAPIYIIALFNYILKLFLKDKVADKSIYASNENKISKDKSLLISRMIFILGISDDESFFDEYRDDGSKSNYLKSYIKKYKTITLPTYNSNYFFEGVNKFKFNTL